MKQILWFRRDLRIKDNAILSNAINEVLPIFIFDRNILDTLPSNDKRVNFIYQSVKNLQIELQSKGLNLQIFYGYPEEIFQNLLQNDDYDEVLCSCDFDAYAVQRDKKIEELLPIRRFYDSYLVHPMDTLKNDGSAYKVFTPFYKNLMPLWDCNHITEYSMALNLKLCSYDFEEIFTLKSIGFEEQTLPFFLMKSAKELIQEFSFKLEKYQEARDFFALDGTSNLATHLRFGLLSPKQVFNQIKKYPHNELFIRQLFWREFYNCILYHFPNSQFENFNGLTMQWSENIDDFQAWCDGGTGVPIIDAAMKHLNTTGLMHNRLRMVVASFLTKNLFIDWRRGEEYFALKLLDYEASSNIGSWQWGASTGADSAPYFRVFNPYAQSEKFDKESVFIKSVLKELKEIDPKLFHKENGVQSNLFVNYPKLIVDIKLSRQQSIEKFKRAKNEAS